MDLSEHVLAVRLSPEYVCSPIWLVFDDGVLDVSVMDLPLDAELARRLRAWDDTYQATYRPNDPASSGFTTSAEKEAFWREGRLLLAALRAEFPGLQVDGTAELTGM